MRRGGQVADREQESNSILSADIHISLFPNLHQFMVIDVRDLADPKVRVVDTTELLTPEYYREIEEEFSGLLRMEGAPFLNLMLLPARLQAMLQQKGMAALAQMFGDPSAGEERNRISLFICSGAILTMKPREMAAAMDAFFGNRVLTSFVDECTKTLLRLLDAERTQLAKKERDELRRAVLGESEQFLTLWQNPPGQEPRQGFSSS
ncbi:MAG: hypothetical protein EXR49_03385 [Dehalococcoidia bacterium]|nr:hypothetical protein [Dehalococcoidia bacterium]